MNKSDEPKPLSPRSAAFFTEIHDDCLPRIDRATVSTIGIQDDEIRHDRTGVLYEIAGQHFTLINSSLWNRVRRASAMDLAA